MSPSSPKVAKPTPSFTFDSSVRAALWEREVGAKGLKVQRHFTKAGKDPFDGIEFELRTSRITNPDGSVVFEMKAVEVPVSWTQVAADVLAQKYFRKKGVPQLDSVGKPLLDKDGNPVLGGETSAKQVVRRLAGTWRYWGEANGYFETKEDADAFEDEMIYLLITQRSAPNSPQWFNTGLAWAYGITGSAQGHFYVDETTGEVKRSDDAYTRPQPHACFIQSIKDDLVGEGGIFDGLTREALLFKYGSGTGSNFSRVRGCNEMLGGGGKSSGLMSFLAVFDRAAGAIKSGGTTRRAAKMVCVDLDHPEIEDFINWKVIEEQKVASLNVGSKICYDRLKAIVESVHLHGDDPVKNPALKALVLKANRDFVPLNYVKRVILMVLENGLTPETFTFRRYDVDFRSEAYATVGGQNSNNSVRITNAFIEAVERDEDWKLVNRVDGTVYKTLKARDLWEQITQAAWMCADPGVQYDTTINEWHTCPEDGRINASNPCSEYMFLDDTACNLASINLVKFYDDESKVFDVEGFRYACHLWTVVLEISVLMAQFPSKSIAELSYKFRTLGLGYANLGTLLMRQGIPYDSEKGLAVCGALTALMCGEAYATSAQMAKIRGVFPGYEKNAGHMARVIRNHRRASYHASEKEYEGLLIKPLGISAELCDKSLLDAARDSWDRALEWGDLHGYRNAQVTVIAPTGTIGLVMDCDTTGIEPDFALVKFKKLVGGGYFKIANQSLKPALENLKYTEAQITDIIHYVKGYGTLKGAPGVSHEALREKGFSETQLMAIEGQLETVFELKFAFNKWILGEDFCQEILNMSPDQLNESDFDVLAHIGFTAEEIEAANVYVCGSMTIEGAPHLKQEDYAVFDCANKCGKTGRRFIHTTGHIRMMAAAQPFISGAISKTINMPEEATVQDVKDAYIASWRYMLKANALYRDGSKLSQPLNTSSMTGNLASIFDFTDDEVEATPEVFQQQVIEKIIQKPFRRKLPAERHSLTHKFSIQGHEGYITCGLYDDGQPGEIFIKMSKEGSTLSGIMDAFALSLSMNLQYGVPIEVLVSKFTHTRFEPAGMTQNPEIPMVKSIMDYLGRWLALKFLSRDTAKKYHNGDLVDRAYEYGTLVKREYPRLQEDFEKIMQQAVTPQEKPAAGLTVERQTLEVKERVVIGGTEQLASLQNNLALRLNNEDAPLCTTCGDVMVRNGACYKCIGCGETSGCS